MPLVTSNASGNNVPPLSNPSVENVSNLEFYEYQLEPEFQILLENNFEGIEYYNIDNNINESFDSNQSKKFQNI